MALQSDQSFILFSYYMYTVTAHLTALMLYRRTGGHWATHENSHIYLFSYYSHHCIKNWKSKDNILSIKWTWYQSNAMIPSNVCFRSTEILLFILLHSKAIWHSCHKIFVDF